MKFDNQLMIVLGVGGLNWFKSQKMITVKYVERKGVEKLTRWQCALIKV